MTRKFLHKSVKILTFSVVLSISFFAFNHTVIAQQQYNGTNSYSSVYNFSEIVDSLEGELKSNPKNLAARLDLISAYTNQAIKLSNDPTLLNKAASYNRKAIFLMQFDNATVPLDIAQSNLSILRDNLTNTLKAQQISCTPKSRLELAKKLRGGAKFEEAVVEFNEAATDPALKAQSLELAADTLRVMQKDLRAAELYNLALTTNANNPMLHLKFARVLNKLGNSEEALKEYNIALNSASDANKTEITDSLEQLWASRIAQNPQDAEALMNMGVVLQKKKKFDEAQKMYIKAEQLDPTNETLRLNMGTLFQQQGDLQLALQAYESILDVNPKNILAQYYRATALRDMGRTNEAVSAFYNVLNMDNSMTSARIDLLNTIKDVKNPEDSLNLTAEYARNFPNDSIAQYNYAYQLHSLKRLDEATEFYQKAIALNPKLTDAYLNLSSVQKEKGLTKESSDTLSRYLKIDPTNAKAKNLLSSINDEMVGASYQNAIDKFNNKDYQGAVDEYQKIINSGDKSEEAYLGLGSAYQELNKDDDAIAAYNKALLINKNNTETLNALAGLYYDKGTFEKAVDLLQKSIVIDSTNKDTIELLKSSKMAASDAIVSSALKDYHLNKYDIALQKFNKASAFNPDNAYPYYYKGIIYDSQKKYTEAVNNFQKAIARDKELHIAYYLMGLSYESLGNKAESIKALQKFLELSKGKDDEYTKYAKYKVQELKAKK